MSPEYETRRRTGSFLFALVFLAMSLLLLSQIAAQAKFSATGQLFAQPAFWPAVSLFGMVLFSVIHVASMYRLEPDGTADNNSGGTEYGRFEWLRVLEYFAWFMCYVVLVPQAGYLPATLLFCVGLAIRAGYRSVSMLSASLFVGLSVVLVFKTFLAVKIPGGELYEFLPDAMRNFMISNF